MDFWNEFRKPHPYRWPILMASMIPIGLLLYVLVGERNYAAPEQPDITYITTFDPERTDAQIAASNIANQEVKELREAHQQAVAERKRDLYKALGRASGMDVDAIEERIARERAEEEEAAAQAEGDADGADAGTSDGAATQGVSQ